MTNKSASGLKLGSKRLGLKTSEAWRAGTRKLGTPEGHKKIQGELASLVDLLVQAQVAVLVAATDRDTDVAVAEVESLLEQIEEEAARVAAWSAGIRLP